MYWIIYYSFIFPSPQAFDRGKCEHAWKIGLIESGLLFIIEGNKMEIDLMFDCSVINLLHVFWGHTHLRYRTIHRKNHLQKKFIDLT